jgi:hypothetical protein
VWRCIPILLTDLSESGSNVTTDGQSASLSWNKAAIWGLRPDSYYCQSVAGFLKWGALCDERTGLSFTTAAGPRQRSHSRVRVYNCCWPSPAQSFSRPSPVGLANIFYCLRLEDFPIFVASEDSHVFDPASTRDTELAKSKLLYDWRFTANQFVLAPGPLRPTTRDVFSN